MLFTRQGDKSVRVMRSLLAAQQTFVDRLVQLMKAVQRESGNRKKKVTDQQQTHYLLLEAEHDGSSFLKKSVIYILSHKVIFSLHL